MIFYTVILPQLFSEPEKLSSKLNKKIENNWCETQSKTTWKVCFCFKNVILEIAFGKSVELVNPLMGGVGK